MNNMTVNSLTEAMKTLIRKGIKFTDVCSSPIYERVNEGFKHRIKERPAIHTYFMNDQNQDVAYFTPCMKTLLIHESPRNWSERNISDADFMGKDYVAMRKAIYQETIDNE